MRRRHGFSWRFSSSVGLELRTGPRHSQHHDTSPSWACAHAIRSPPCEKSFKYRLKSITQRSLTEIDPSRKSAAARKNLFLGNGFLGADRLTRTGLVPRTRSSHRKLPRVRLRTSGSKRHWNHRVASVLRFRSPLRSVRQTRANFGIGTLARPLCPGAGHCRQRECQRDETLDRYVLGARRGIYLRGAQQGERIDTDRFETLTQ